MALHLHAREALLPGGWHSHVRLTVREGMIAAIELDTAPAPADERHAVLLPGMPNLHSHAFQRGLAGLAERRSGKSESFWSWREVMYRFALALDPGQMQAAAALAYMEMLEAGFTRVGEFHYLHHERDGRPYADIAEMAGRIAAAASATGIGLTLMPVFYAHSNFGGQPPEAGQRRFVTSLERYERLLEKSTAALRYLEGAAAGVAPHSLRAVTPEQLRTVVNLLPGAPVHIHIAEQAREVEDCISWYGARPVDWLFDHADVDVRWCLIHATHMSEAETRRLAASTAAAGLCPVTEANLGDGIFAGQAYAGHGGRFGIGTDSNVLIGVADELRQLEYAQRLQHRARTILAPPGHSSARAMFDTALRGGAQALGAGLAGLQAGAAADIVSLDCACPSLCGLSGDALLDAWVFAGGNSVVDCVWARGRQVVSGGRHKARAQIVPAYCAAIAALRAA